MPPKEQPYEKVPDEEPSGGGGYPRTVQNEGGGEFATNYISTTSYTRFTFLPKATAKQYKRGANVYLLFIAILCCIPAISPLMPIAAVMPVVFVLSISLIREGMEDYARYKADEELNSKTCLVRSAGAQGQFKDVMWKDVCVGDLVKLHDRDWIPADVCLFTSSAEDGAAFIDTMDLDGETNLKRRGSPKSTTGIALEDTGRLAKAVLKCVGPSGDLYSFDGTLTFEGKTLAVSEQNILLRSARLRNTKWAVGYVVYTGEESKVMMNSRSGSVKQSALETIVNKGIAVIFLTQLAMAVISAGLSGGWASKNCATHWYLKCDASGAKTGSMTFWTYIILLNSLIPASLIVTMEIVKVVHARFIDWDHVLVKQYDKKEEKWRRAEAHTSALNEGLGQIDYVFSDKTGTLTENKMELRYVCVDAEVYSADSGEWFETGPAANNRPISIKASGDGGGTEQRVASVNRSSGYTFNRMLAVCQTVLIEREPDGSVSYNADSPDEVALVLGGRGFGCEFTGKQGGDTALVDVYASGKQGQGDKVEEQWKVLNIIPFSSKRKRMTTIVQRVNPPPEDPNECQVWMKGADNVIRDRIIKGPLMEKYDNQLLYFSMDGLRTLCFSSKTISMDEQRRWADEWEGATLLPPAEREAKFEDLAKEVEDSGMNLVGCTAVEDKLQQNVPETIVRLARAKINLWVLTGDKQETAIEIGKSTNLLTGSMKLFIVNSNSEAEVNQRLDTCLSDAVFNNEGQKKGLVIDGGTLNFIIEGNQDGALVCHSPADKFVALATQCVSVVVCRSSPLQKALIVLLVKKYVPTMRSLGIGDGANDVPMIRAANIGIGIAGLEGMQAARASDYAIQQFQDLDRLLLHHGRLSYFRVANMCTYFFYKSWTFTLPQWMFGFYNGYSGQTFYEALYVPSFNMFFTAAPVFARAVLDTDLDVSKANPLLPELYHVSKEDKLFSPKVLGADLLLSFVHAAACYWLPMLSFGLDDSDLWQESLATYSLIVFVCTMRITCHTRAFTIPLVIAYTASIALYMSWLFTYDSIGTLTIRGAAPALVNENAKFKYLVFMALGATGCSELCMRWYIDNVTMTNVDVVRAAKEADIAQEGDRRNKEASASQNA